MNTRIVICSAIVVVALVSGLSAAPPAAIAPFGTEEAKAHQQAWSRYLGVPVELTNSIGMRLVLIPPGEFEMGASEDEIERHTRRYQREHPKEDSGTELRRIGGEGPRHRVRITQPYYLGVSEVTQEQYIRVMDTIPGGLTSSANAQRPVGRVSWYLAKEFCQKLSGLSDERAAGRVYDLPTEAQWEFACRAGTKTEFPFGDDEGELDDYAWYRANAKESQDSAARSHQVAQKKPNAWGLHDMLGNVWEWCSDWYDLDYYANSPLADPAGPELTQEQETSHVMRGGKFGDFLVWPSKRSCPNDARGPKKWLQTQASWTRGFRVLCRIGGTSEVDPRAPKLIDRTPVSSPIRTWTDATGKFTIQAKLVKFQGMAVRLLAVNGKTIDLSVDRLSEADQSFLRTTIRGKNEQPSQKGDWIELIGPQGPTGIARVGGNIALCDDVRFDPNSKSLTPLPGNGVVAAVTKTRFGGANNLLSKQKFGDCEVQLEFLIGKGSNSGVKLQQRYEIQLFDSHGKAKPTATDCGGIYPHWRFGGKGKGLEYIDKGFPPRANAAKPAGQWQTLNILFTAPRFDSSGKKIENARFNSVVLNGTTIHEDIELDSPTGNTSKPMPETPDAPLFLQLDHGAVAFRNVRVRPLADPRF